MSEDVLSHIERMPFTISQIDVLCPSRREDFPKFILLSGDRVYTAQDKSLTVYSVKFPPDPIATYNLGERCFTAEIVENCLYMCSPR